MKTRNTRIQVAAKSRARGKAHKPTPHLPVFPSEVQLKMLHNTSGLFSRLWNWFRERQAARADAKRLHVAASVSLGEKRFIAVIQVDGQQFLVGGGATNVSLLAQVAANEPLNSVLENAMSAQKVQPARRARRRVATPLPEELSGSASFGKAQQKAIDAKKKRSTKRMKSYKATPLAEQLKGNGSFSNVLHEAIGDPKKRMAKRVKPQVSTSLAEQLKANDSLSGVLGEAINIPKKPPTKEISLLMSTPETGRLSERA
jgi:flagellar biogenesis protein FliO